MQGAAHDHSSRRTDHTQTGHYPDDSESHSAQSRDSISTYRIMPPPPPHRPSWELLETGDNPEWKDMPNMGTNTSWRWRPAAAKAKGPALIFFPSSGYFAFQNLRPPYFSDTVAACATLIELADHLPNFSILVVEYPTFQNSSPSIFPEALDAGMAALMVERQANIYWKPSSTAPSEPCRG